MDVAFQTVEERADFLFVWFGLVFAFVLFCFVWPHRCHAARRILVPGMEPGPWQ